MKLLEILQYGFMQKALITGTMVALLCSILGYFLVLRRWSLIGDSLAHVSFGSIALSLFLGVYPLYVAIPTVILGSVFILKLTEKARMYSDAAIGIVSAVGVSSGIILIGLSHGFNADLFSYLFGNILAIDTVEMWTAIILSCVVLFIIRLFYLDLFSITFDEEYARVTGIRAGLLNYLIVVLTAITVVFAIKVIGVMLVSSFLILPAVTAMQLRKGFTPTLAYSAIVAVLSVVIGITLSFLLDLPAGATIVMTNFFFFVGAFGYKKIV